jgi:hypothetical protein
VPGIGRLRCFTSSDLTTAIASAIDAAQPANIIPFQNTAANPAPQKFNIPEQLLSHIQLLRLSVRAARVRMTMPRTLSGLSPRHAAALVSAPTPTVPIMTLDLRCNAHDIRKIESLLLDHEIARSYFRGELYDRLGNRFDGVSLELIGGNPVQLDMETSARLFMIPDKSTARVLNVNEHGNSPAGMKIHFVNSFVPEGELNSVIVIRIEKTPGVWCDALYIETMMLRQDAPAGLCTVAFGLMAVTAWRLGFDHIQVYAAGRGPLHPADPDAIIGYCIWPKFGFDAPVNVAEMSRHPTVSMHGLSTVQEVVARTPAWWEACGSGRLMQFDLCPTSQSWSILIKYLWTTLTDF